MSISIAESLESNLEEAKNRVKKTAAALDDAIITDPELSHKTRMVLIHLQSTVRQQNLILDLMAVHLDYLDKRCDNIIQYVTK